MIFFINAINFIKVGLDAIKKIKEDETVLLSISGITDSKAKTIRDSLLAYSDSEDSLVKYIKKVASDCNSFIKIFIHY